MSGRLKKTICSVCGNSLAALAFSTTAGHADLVISSGATSNMSCGDGICEPTASKAVLNAGDLQNYIVEFGNMTVQTTGNGVEANNIVVEAKLASPGSSTLNLFAHGAIRVDAAVTIGSSGEPSELEVTSGTGGELGALSFGAKGNISFGSASGRFGINGGAFTLEDSLPHLANAISSNPGGFYALAKSYDAKKDGTYSSAPVSTEYTGYFEALGNVISGLRINDQGPFLVGLFAVINGSGGFGVVRNLKIEHASIQGGSGSSVGAIVGSLAEGAMLVQSSATGKIHGGDTSVAGGLVGLGGGTIDSSWSSAKVTGDGSAQIGGVAGFNDGIISNSYSKGHVTGGSYAGGLSGTNYGTVSVSFATGAVTSDGNGARAGGLIGVNFGSIADCYAIGNVTETGGGSSSDLGGLIGDDESTVTSSYTTGSVAGSGSDVIGGVVGYDGSGGGFTDTYWDTTTSGLTQGAGNIADDPGLGGLTTQQFQSGLPAGFEKSVWKEKGKTNNGLPYLIANPPPK